VHSPPGTTRIESIDMAKHKSTQARRQQPQPTTRTTLSVSTEAYRRLLVHSMMENQPAGAIVSRLILEGLRSWGMPADLSGRGKVSDRPSPAAELNPAGEIAA
jgi:hypothetical protein